MLVQHSKMIPKNSEKNGRKVRHNLKHRFELVRTLGQGTYGKVKLAVEKATGLEYAIKTIKKQKIDNEQDLTRIRREIEIMATLSHPHITSVYEVFENAEKIILVMEFASGGELYDYINDKQGLYEEEARKFFRQIVSAVHYLHMNGIVHRDLKLENIVMDRKGNAMIADFGLANIFSKNNLLSTYCGSPLYASPEIVNGLPYTGPEVDCWSLGVLLFTLVYGAMPFDGSDFRKLRNQITAGNYYEPDHPSDAAGLIRHLLTPNPSKRATIHDICDHWWTNLGYDCTPVDDTIPGKPVNYAALEKSLSKSSYSSSDSDSDHHEYESGRKAPIKGILKKPNKVDPNCQPKRSSADKKEKKLNGVETVLASKNVDHENIPAPVKKQSSTCTSKASKPEPKRGILKNTKGNQYSGSDSGCVIDETVGGSVDSACTTISSRDSVDTETSDNGAQSQTDTSEAHIVLDDSYELGDIESVLDEMSLNENGKANDNQLSPAENSLTEEVPVHANCSQSSAITENSTPEMNEEEKQQLADAETPQINQTMFNNACNTARELFESISTSTPARRIRGILKRNGKFSNATKMSDPTWRYSAGSAGSTSSGDLLDFSYDSGEGELLNIDPNALPKHSLSLPRKTLPRQTEAVEDEEDESPPPPLPTSPPPVLSSSLLRELENKENTGEPGEINFDDIDDYEPGEIKYSDQNGVNRIVIKREDDDIINKINFFDEELSENESRDSPPPTLLDLAEARGVYKKALEICKW